VAKRLYRFPWGLSVKSALLAQLALCACPPLVAVAAVKAVPQVRHAVHRATAPKPHHGATRAARQPDRHCVERQQTDARTPIADDLVQDLTNLDGAGQPARDPGNLIPDLASQQQPGKPRGSGFNAVPPIFPMTAGYAGPLPGRPGAPVGPGGPSDPGPTPGAVPEPSNWALMLFGFGAIGAAIRSGRRGRTKGRMPAAVRSAMGLAATLESGTGATLVSANVGASAKAGALGLHAARAAALKQVGVCVCSAAALATAATTVPPLRHALYAATMPAVERPRLAPSCDPSAAGGAGPSRLGKASISD